MSGRTGSAVLFATLSKAPPDKNKSNRKSHNLLQDRVVPLSYADVAKTPKKVGNQRNSEKKNKSGLLSTETSTSFHRVTTKVVAVSYDSSCYPPKEGKSRVIKRKFRLVPNPNTLDSRAPQLIRRGKEKATDYKKKQTKLKRTILQARSRERKSLDTAEVQQANETPKANSSQEEHNASSKSSLTQNGGTKPSSKKVKYREYCDMYVTKNINMLTEKLLSELMRFQERVRKTQPAKAKAKRRIVIGLKETIQCLQVNKLKCVIIPPDIEPCPLQGGLDDRLALIRELSTDKQVPIVYALGVHKIPKALGLPSRRHKTSAVGIYSYEGAFELFKQVLEEARKERERWRQNHDASLQSVVDTCQLSADAEPFIPAIFQECRTVG